MELRKLTEQDAEAYWQVRLRMLRKHPEAFGRSYEEAVAEPVSAALERFRTQSIQGDNFIIGAFDAGLLAGTAGFRRDEGVKMRHKGMIWGVYVAPEVRGRGLGRALMREAVERASTLPSLEIVYLAVSAPNAPARSLYLSLGFEIYGREPHALKLVDRYVDEDLMALRLT